MTLVNRTLVSDALLDRDLSVDGLLSLCAAQDVSMFRERAGNVVVLSGR